MAITSDQALDLVKTYFAIQGTIKPLGSCQDFNFRLATDCGTKYVVKLTNPETTEDEIIFQNSILQFLSSSKLGQTIQFPLLQCLKDQPSVFHTKVIINDSVYILRLLTYVDGKMLSEFPHLSPTSLRDFGVFVRIFHDTLLEFPACLDSLQSDKFTSRETQWDLRFSLRVIENQVNFAVENELERNQLLKLSRDMFGIVQSLSPNLRSQFVHGDLADYNLIASRLGDDGRPSVSGVIDFGDVVHSWAVGDLAIALVPLFVRNVRSLFKPQKAGREKTATEGESDEEQEEGEEDGTAPQSTLALLGSVFHVLKGYNHHARAHPLLSASSVPFSEAECSALWPLVVLRSIILHVSVRHQYRLDQQAGRENEYLRRESGLNERVLRAVLSIPFSTAEQVVRNAMESPNLKLTELHHLAVLPLPTLSSAQVLEGFVQLNGQSLQALPLDLSVHSPLLSFGNWLPPSPDSPCINQPPSLESVEGALCEAIVQLQSSGHSPLLSPPTPYSPPSPHNVGTALFLPHGVPLFTRGSKPRNFRAPRSIPLGVRVFPILPSKHAEESVALLLPCDSSSLSIRTFLLPELDLSEHKLRGFGVSSGEEYDEPSESEPHIDIDGERCLFPALHQSEERARLTSTSPATDRLVSCILLEFSVTKEGKGKGAESITLLIEGAELLPSLDPSSLKKGDPFARLSPTYGLQTRLYPSSGPSFCLPFLHLQCIPQGLSLVGSASHWEKVNLPGSYSPHFLPPLFCSEEDWVLAWHTARGEATEEIEKDEGEEVGAGHLWDISADPLYLLSRLQTSQSEPSIPSSPLPLVSSRIVKSPSAFTSVQRRLTSYAAVQAFYYSSRYHTPPPQIERAYRQFLYDTHGRGFLDMVNNVAVLGHCHPWVCFNAQRQMSTLNTNSRFIYQALGEYTSRIIEKMPQPPEGSTSGKMEVVFLVNSGSEATDLAMRIARKVVTDRRKREHLALMRKQRGEVDGPSALSFEEEAASFVFPLQRDLICMEGGYHGVTTASDEVSTTLNDNPMSLLTRAPWIHLVPLPNLYRGRHRKSHSTSSFLNSSSLDCFDPEEDRQAAQYAAHVTAKINEVREKTGHEPTCFISEPLSGNAGGVELPQGYLSRVYRQMHDVGGLCIADEVQVGYGRLGTHFWGFQEHKELVRDPESGEVVGLSSEHVRPDIITMAKAAGNGHPLGFVVTSEEIAREFGMDGSSFFSSAGGGPVSCVIGKSVLDVLEKEGLQSNALDVGSYLNGQLKALQARHPRVIGCIHGHGLYQGVEIIRDPSLFPSSPPLPGTQEAYAICERLLDLGVICHNTGDYSNVLKVKPPLCFSREDADYFVRALELCVEKGW